MSPSNILNGRMNMRNFQTLELHDHTKKPSMSSSDKSTKSAERKKEKKIIESLNKVKNNVV
jgi:hypothetical protein